MPAAAPQSNRLIAHHRPAMASTVLLLFGLLGTYATIEVGLPTEMLTRASLIVGISLGLSYALEAHLSSLRNLIRVDNAGLLAIYFLTLFEFLFPQPAFDLLITGEQAKNGIHLVLLAIAMVALGRHLVPPRPWKRGLAGVPLMNNRTLFGFAVFCFILAHLHMWVAVGFNPSSWIQQMLGGRFTQSWQRGRLGGVGALLSELHLLSYLIPPIGAILWVRRRQIPFWMLFGMGAMLCLLFFSGLSLGTRYQFAIYFIGFGAAWLLAMPQIRVVRLAFLAAPAIAVSVAMFFLIIHVRNLGLKNTAEIIVNDSFQGQIGARDLLFEGIAQNENFRFTIDRNMYPISILPDFFPSRHAFLEEELLVHALVRPIPRAIWPGKPEALSVTMESIIGVETATIASTFIGESFMSAGWSGVMAAGLLMGIFFGLWNRIPVPRDNATLILLYSSGFFWATIGIRSIVWISVGFLPCLALALYAWLVLPALTRSRPVARPISDSL